MNSPTPTPKVNFLLLGLGLGHIRARQRIREAFFAHTLTSTTTLQLYHTLICTLLIVHPTSRPQTNRHGRPHTKLLPSIIQWTVVTVSVYYTVVMVQNYAFPYAKTNGLLWKSLSQFSIFLAPLPTQILEMAFSFLNKPFSFYNLFIYFQIK